MCCHLCKLSKNARLTLIAALTQFRSHVNSHSVHRFLATHSGNRIAIGQLHALQSAAAAHLEFVAVWQPIQLAIGLQSALLLYAFRLLFVCSSFVSFFACFFMVVLRLPLLLLLPSGLVFYVVNVLRYARLTGKGKADFLAEPARPGTRTD